MESKNPRDKKLPQKSTQNRPKTAKFSTKPANFVNPLSKIHRFVT